MAGDLPNLCALERQLASSSSHIFKRGQQDSEQSPDLLCVLH